MDLPIGWNVGLPKRAVDGKVVVPAQTDWLQTLLGWLITAFAATLGAPFWFDLLNKVSVVRSTVKPREKSPDEASDDRRNVGPADGDRRSSRLVADTREPMQMTAVARAPAGPAVQQRHLAQIGRQTPIRGGMGVKQLGLSRLGRRPHGLLRRRLAHQERETSSGSADRGVRLGFSGAGWRIKSGRQARASGGAPDRRRGRCRRPASTRPW